MLRHLISDRLKSIALSNKSFFATHKLTYGQGGTCLINLCNPLRNYKVEFETIWEDYCNIQFQSEEQKRNITITEDGGKATLTDENYQNQDLKANDQKQKIKDVLIKFQIPEDFTFHGQINGSISHKKSVVSNKLRCNQMKIKLLNKSRVFQWGSMQSPVVDIDVANGAVDIKSLTFQNGRIRSNSFHSSKVLFSGKLDLQTTHSVNIRSVVTYGNAVAKIVTRYAQIQSISGTFDIHAQKVKIDRMWASPQGIKINTQKIQKIGIQTGTGIVQSVQPIGEGQVTLGRLHKGTITRVGVNKLLIQ